jgi:hypothetical protein
MVDAKERRSRGQLGKPGLFKKLKQENQSVLRLCILADDDARS